MRSLDTANSAHLDQVFSALSDRTRRAILSQLMRGDASVSDLARPFELAQPTISKHLKVLEKAGLVAQGRDAQWRPRQLMPAPLKEAADWLEPFKCEWEARLSSLQRYLAPKITQEATVGRGRHKGSR